jgi:hypothetical protein
MYARVTLLAVAALALGGCAGNHRRAAATAARMAAVPCGTYSGRGCAPDRARVDLRTPVFTHPTRITNPLFPIARLRSAVLLGHVSGKPFRTETTLLGGTATVTWNGKRIPVLVSQYMAYLDGRLEEVALDRYAQADDGSVWYFGEDVADYERGAITTTEGTWLAGREGPPAMIMPAHPRVGDTYRTENVPGVVFEEVSVKSVGTTVDGPHGRVPGAMIGSELHADRTSEDKVFAPGYGEFRTAGGGDLEAMAEAVPVDARPVATPAALAALAVNSEGIIESARVADWRAVTATVGRMRGEWASLRPGAPPLIAARMTASMDALGRAVPGRRVGAIAQAAIGVWQSVLDLELRHRPPAQVDAARFHVWTQQLRVDAAARDLARVTGDVATLEWIRDRFAPALPAAARGELDARLRDLRAATNARNLPEAADVAARLGARVRVLAP